jgi:hypothetical protein
VYRYLRNTHLYLGLSCCLFVLMYGVSSVQMSHNTWFNLRPSVTVSRYSIAPGISDARAVARELMDRHDVRGEVTLVRTSPAGAAFSMQRPGTVYQVEYTAATGETKVRDNHAGFMGMMNRIHHAAGVRHEYWLINAWGWLVGMVSLALIILGATGIYLWFKLYKERLAGSILLAIGLVYSVSVLVMLRIAW